MRFAFVSTMAGASWGGSEELWSQAAMLLGRLGHQVFASVNYWPKPSSKLTALAEQGVKLHMRRPPAGSMIGKAWEKTTRILWAETGDFRWLQRQQPDLVVISQGCVIEGLEWLSFCRQAALPFVVISQCNAELWWPADSLAGLMASAFAAARKLFFVSRANLQLLERQLGENLPNAKIVQNPFGVPPGQPLAWPVETGVWRLACVARLDPAAKGQDLLFQVLTQPAWRERPVEVNLYGTGPFERGLQRLAGRLQLPQVVFRGHVEDIPTIWRHNHLLVLPSRYEGLPLALVEAMWCGRAALITEIAGAGELVLDHETGFVAAAPTAALLAQTMETAWARRSEWQKMGLAARSRVKKTISQDPVADFCQQLLASIPQPRQTHANEAELILSTHPGR